MGLISWMALGEGACTAVVAFAVGGWLGAIDAAVSTASRCRYLRARPCCLRGLATIGALEIGKARCVGAG